MNQQKPYSLVNLEAVRNHFHQACQSRTPVRLWHAVADIPVLLAELSRLRSLLALVRTMHANLLAAARATVAAARDGEADSMYYLRDELAAHDQLPPDHLHAAELLGQPYSETIDDSAGEQDSQ
ncbi:MAG: hypothetical protein ACRDSL_10635 [Pseudonocardiaceae bacterium]